MSSSNWRWIKNEEADDVDWILMTEMKHGPSGNFIKAAKPDFKRKLAEKHLRATLNLQDSQFWSEKLEKKRQTLELFIKETG